MSIEFHQTIGYILITGLNLDEIKYNVRIFLQKNRIPILIHFYYQHYLTLPRCKCVHISNYLTHSHLLKFATSIERLSLFSLC